MSTWVLLRGLMRESRHWGDFVPQLQAARPHDQIICLDWPGNGALHQQPSYSSIADMARYCQQTLDQKGHSGPYHVVAISLGAMAALEWAYQRPEHFASCTLINTSLRQFSPLHQRLNSANWPQLLTLLCSASAERESIILALTSNTAGAAIAQQWQSYAREYPMRTVNVLRQLWAASRYRAAATPPAVPLLLLNSLGDQLVDPACSEQIASAWHCALARHPSAGHDLPLDDPHWVIQQIEHHFLSN